MEYLEVGDEVFDQDGKPTKVVATTDPMTDRQCYEVELSDGSRFVADAQHQWVTFTKTERVRRKAGRQAEPTSKTTQELAATAARGQEWNHHIPLGRARRLRRARPTFRSTPTCSVSGSATEPPARPR